MSALKDRIQNRPLRIVTWVLIIFAILIICAFVGINIYARVTFGPFYAQAKEEFAIPGVNNGFVPQDLDYLEEDGSWLFSGYMADDSDSPVYRRMPDGSSMRFYVILPNGEYYRGHGGGITSTDTYVFLTTEQGYCVMRKDDVLAVENEAAVTCVGEQSLDFSPAFLNEENGILYTGNYYYPGAYETPAEHHIMATDGTENPAVMYAYASDASAPYGVATEASEVYSIPSRCQGMCVTDSYIVLSTSANIETSHLWVYNRSKIMQHGTFFADNQDVALYILDSNCLAKDIIAPAMAEGIENVNGRIYVSDESASNKYIFGKLYGAGKVYSLEP